MKIINLIYNNITDNYFISYGKIGYGKNREGLGSFDIDDEKEFNKLINSVKQYIDPKRNILLRIDKYFPKKVLDELLDIFNSSNYKKLEIKTLEGYD